MDCYRSTYLTISQILLRYSCDQNRQELCALLAIVSNMRAAFGVLLLIVAVASATETASSTLESGVYDYHRRYGIPQAEKIRQNENGILSGQRVAGGSTTTTLSVPYQVGRI